MKLLVNVSIFTVSCGLVLALTFGGLAGATERQCWYKVEQSYGCKECTKACPTCPTYGKCGDPDDSGRCEGPDWGPQNACSETSGVACPGLSYIWNNRDDCVNEDPNFYGPFMGCGILSLVYDSAQNIPPTVNCE